MISILRCLVVPFHYLRSLFSYCTYSRLRGVSGKPGLNGITIYGTYDSIGSYIRHQNRIHKWFKYGFITIVLRVGMLLSKGILGRYYVTPDKICKGVYYDQLRLFVDSFDKGVHDWHYGFHCSNTISNHVTSIDDRYCVKMLRFMRDIVLTICHNDTAYYDLLQKIMFHVTINECASPLNNGHGGLEQIMYTSHSVMDVTYFIAVQDVGKGVVLGKIDIDKIYQVYGG